MTVTAVIAAGFTSDPGPPAMEMAAGPATEAPDRSFAETVAALVAAAHAADRATGSTADARAPSEAPPAEGSATPTDLLALLAGLIARMHGKNGEGTAPTQTSQTPLLDRPAEAGGDEEEPGAMDTLVAALLARFAPTAQPREDGVAHVAAVLREVQAALGSGADAGEPGSVPSTDIDGAGEQLVTGGAVIGDAAHHEGDGDVLTAAAAIVEAAAETPSTEDTAAASSMQTDTAPADAVEQAAPPLPGNPSAAEGRGSTPSESPPSTGAEGAGDPAGAAALADGAVSEQVAGTPSSSAGSQPSIDGAASPLATPPPPVQGEAAARASATEPRASTAGPVTVQLASTVQAAVLRGDHEVRLVLNPPELGRVEVRIVETAGGLRVLMQAEHAGARDLIERQLPMLHQALEARELRVERVEVARPESLADGQQSLDSRAFDDRRGDDGTGGGEQEWSPLAALGVTPESSSPMTGGADPVETASGRIDFLA
ncbi:MAG: flagellar hook-length control protein FliK [Dehalococcoidia bacterium]